MAALTTLQMANTVQQHVWTSNTIINRVNSFSTSDGVLVANSYLTPNYPSNTYAHSVFAETGTANIFTTNNTFQDVTLFNANVVATGSFITSANVELGLNQRLVLDDDRDTYLVTSADDILEIHNAGTLRTQWTGVGLIIRNGTLFLDEQAAAESDTAGWGQVWVENLGPNILRYTNDVGTDFTPAMIETGYTWSGAHTYSANVNFSDVVHASANVVVIGNVITAANVELGLNQRLVLDDDRDSYIVASGDDIVDFYVASAVKATMVSTGVQIKNGTLKIEEQAAAAGDTANYGQLWVKTVTPNELWFTNDAGTDYAVGAIPITKGRLLVSNAASIQGLNVGTDGQVVIANSSHASGLQWKAQSPGGGPSVGSRSFIRTNAVEIAEDITLHEANTVFTVDTGADELDGVDNTIFTNGEVVQVTTSATLPGPLANNTNYYVINADADSIQLAVVRGGAAINISNTGAGVHKIYRPINGVTAGPISVANTFTITVPYGSTWTVV